MASLVPADEFPRTNQGLGDAAVETLSGIEPYGLVLFLPGGRPGRQLVLPGCRSECGARNRPDIAAGRQHVCTPLRRHGRGDHGPSPDYVEYLGGERLQPGRIQIIQHYYGGAMIHQVAHTKTHEFGERARISRQYHGHIAAERCT